MKRACIVVSTHNEAANLRGHLPRILQVAGQITTHELHILIVDDSSPGGTALLVAEWAKKEPRLHLSSGKKVGLGEAYKRGIAFAFANLNPDLIIQMDADQQRDPALLENRFSWSLRLTRKSMWML